MFFKCPHCGDATVPLRDKVKTSLWAAVHCGACGGRIAAYPWILAGVYFAHAWNVMWWVGLYHFNGKPVYFAYMALLWAVIEGLSVRFVPLARLRARRPS